MKKLKRIHVNRHVLVANKKRNELLKPWSAPIGVEEAGQPTRYAHGVLINGPSNVVYSESYPLSCGARVWIETYAPVTLLREEKK